MPDGGDRLPRLQERAAQAHAAPAGGDPRAPAGLRGEAGPDRRDPARGIAAGAEGRAGHDGRGARGGASDAMSESATTSDLTLRVGTFEGPFDLLLHLCRTNE